MDSMKAAGEYRDTINYYGPPESEEPDVLPAGHLHTSIRLTESHRDTERDNDQQLDSAGTQTFSHLSFDPTASPTYGTISSQNV